MSERNSSLDRMTMRCATCKHRGDDPLETYRWDEEGEPRVTYYECKRVAHGNKSSSEAEDYKPGEHALVIDGSGYRARLVVENTFGCVLWEQKPE